MGIGDKLKMQIDYNISLAEIQGEDVIRKSAHPWGHFLHARRLAMAWLREEGYSDEQIAHAMSMDTMQVTLILLTWVEQ